MTPAQQRFLDRLSGDLPAKVIVTDPDAIAPWTSDWRGRLHGAAPILLQPAETQEVAAIVRAAEDTGVPLVSQGGNTSMAGGATPPADGHAAILSLRRMNRIRAIDPQANLATVEAGVILSDLHAAAEGERRRFPLSLGAKGSATVGGLVSTNAGGTQVLRWGTMRGLVAGVEAVLSGGLIHDGTRVLKKDNRGYNLDQLLIGAEGTIGIVTAATLRLAPAIGARAVAWAGLADPAAALTLLRRMERATDMVESFELIPDASLQAVLAHVPNTRSPLAGVHAWHVLVEAVDADPAGDPAALLERMLGEAIGDGLVADAALAASEAQAGAFWHIRESISEGERATGPAAQHDVSVPVDAMPRFLVEASAACEARFPGTHAHGFGHLGDGNVHFHVRAPAGSDAARWYAQEAPAITRFVNDMVTGMHGSISAEHGIGAFKRGELARLASPARLQALAAIKAAMDPAGVFNPGKLLP